MGQFFLGRGDYGTAYTIQNSDNYSDMGGIVFNKIEAYIYEYLIAGVPQIKIVKLWYKKHYGKQNIGREKKNRILKRLRQQVSYYTRKMERNGLVKPVTKDQHVKIYRATSLTPRLSETATPRLSENDCWEQSCNININETDITVHHISYKFKVQSEPKRDIHWDKGPTKLRSGVEQSFLYWPSQSDPEHVTIRYHKCPNSADEIVLWLPSTVIPAGQHKNKIEVMDEHVCGFIANIQRILQCRLGLPEIYREPHYETPLQQSELIDFIESGRTFKNGDIHMDDSPPKGSPGFEGPFEKVKCYSELPDRVLRMEEYIDKAHDRFGRIENVLEKVVFSLDKITESQNKLVEAQNELVNSQRMFQESISELIGIREEKAKIREKESSNMFS